MSAAAIEAEQQPFNRKTLFWGIFASLLAGAGFFLLATYAPDFRLGREGGASPLSKSGVGFAGLVELMSLSGNPPVMAHDADDLWEEGLLIVPISPDSDRAALDDILSIRDELPTLFVLPKWQTGPLAGHQGWEMQHGRLPESVVDEWLERIAPGMELGIGQAGARELDVSYRRFAVAAPADLQWVASNQRLISAGVDKAVLFAVPNSPFFVLTDPDLLDNFALRDKDGAAAAVALVAMLAPDDEPVMFDLTLLGLGRTHDLGKLLVEPPFLALTLTVLVAAGLAFLHGLVRFGAPQAEARGAPFGKRSLVDTTAMLLGRAGRLDGMGGRYGNVMRARAGLLLGAPLSLQGAALDQWLDTRDKSEQHGFTSRLDAVNAAVGRIAMLAAALRLHEWITRRSSERR